MQRIDSGRAVSISILTVMCLSVCGCSSRGVQELLGCSWDVSDLSQEGDGGFARLAGQGPTDDNYLVYFYEYPFGGLGTWADPVTEEQGDHELTFRQFVTNEEVPSSGVVVNVVERFGFGAHVVVFNQSPTSLLKECAA